MNFQQNEKNGMASDGAIFGKTPEEAKRIGEIVFHRKVLNAVHELDNIESYCQAIRKELEGGLVENFIGTGYIYEKTGWIKKSAEYIEEMTKRGMPQ